MSKPQTSAPFAHHVVYAVHLLLLALVLSTAMGFDLRHDWSHMDTLRRLPVSGLQLVIAEILPVAAIAWLIQGTAAAVAAFHLGIPWLTCGLAVATSPLILWLCYVLHNLAAIWFPAVPASGPSYNFVVRTMVATTIAYGLIGSLIGVSVIAGYGAWILTGSKTATAFVPIGSALVMNGVATLFLARTFERTELRPRTPR